MAIRHTLQFFQRAPVLAEPAEHINILLHICHMAFRKLTEEEEKIIIYKGTEKPFSGEYEYLNIPPTSLGVAD